MRRRYEVDCILCQVGLDPSDARGDDMISLRSDYLDRLDDFHPGNKSPSAWKALVKTTRDRLLKALTTKGCQFKNALNGMTPNLASMPVELIRLLDKKYFLKDFEARTKEAQDITDRVAEMSSLNKEQERAYRIIANHASSLAPDQLKMYIGGMAGTGKSRVVHAIKKFFELRKEDGRYVVIAPTGTAAAQLNGSTYHSLLGIGDQSGDKAQRNDQTALRTAQERLTGVEYVIFDEISMVPCHDLYKISARLCEIKNNPEEIFGRLNIIVLGDFAQLSPVYGKSLYSGEAMNLSARCKPRDQDTYLGRAIWHQFTTVVMLVQNMRQLQESDRDRMFRDCLVNMRYGACTQANIAFLQSLVVKPDNLQPSFRNSAIITRYNAQKDRFNELGIARFARENRQKLYDFYSEDAMSHVDEDTKKRKRKKYVKISTLSLETQERLWSLPPSANNKHIPGKLTLCKGLPVLIRNNDATELCITKGQDPVVLG